MPRRQRNKPKIAFRLAKSKLITLSILVIIITFFALVFAKTSALVPEVFTIAATKEDGNIEIRVVEIKKNKITKVVVPYDTEVSLAMRRGTLRAQSVVKLIDSEKLPGQFLADTVMRTFYLPVDYWQVYGDSDLPLFISLRLRIPKLRGFQEEVINLSETSFLTKTKLRDGEEGYEAQDKTPLFLASLFADSNFSTRQTAVGVVNATGEGEYVLSEVVKVFETLGAKVAPISSVEEKDVSCVVSASDKKILERVAEVFNCDKDSAPPKAFDIELLLGSKFYNRF